MQNLKISECKFFTLNYWLMLFIPQRLLNLLHKKMLLNKDFSTILKSCSMVFVVCSFPQRKNGSGI